MSKLVEYRTKAYELQRELDQYRGKYDDEHLATVDYLLRTSRTLLDAAKALIEIRDKPEPTEQTDGD